MAARAQHFEELATTAPALSGVEPAIHVWPIGATEQHGPHLPNGTDTYILEALRKRVVAELEDEVGTVWLPPLVFGNSVEHVGFPGTLSLSPSTMMAVVEDVCSSLHAAGVRNIAFLNGHGGNVGTLTVMLREIRHRFGMRTYLLRPLALLGSSSHGGVDMHAGELETSVMLAVRPDLVALDRLPDPDLANAVIPNDARTMSSLGWVTRDLSYNGVIGDARSASAHAGQLLVQRMVEFLTGELRQFARLLDNSLPEPTGKSPTSANRKAHGDG